MIIMKSNNTTYRVLTVLCAMLLFLVSGQQEARAQQVGIKTNALMWAGLTPNLGCEVVIGEHSSLDLSAFGNYMSFSKDATATRPEDLMFFSKLIAFQPEYRYWFNGRPMVREYIGVSTMLATYDMHMNQYYYDGNAISLGLTGGYSFILGSNWRLELCGGFGVLFFHQKQYHETDDSLLGKSESANSHGYKLFPAKLGVTFTYIIK